MGIRDAVMQPPCLEQEKQFQHVSQPVENHLKEADKSEIARKEVHGGQMVSAWSKGTRIRLTVGSMLLCCYFVILGMGC